MQKVLFPSHSTWNIPYLASHSALGMETHIAADSIQFTYLKDKSLVLSKWHFLQGSSPSFSQNDSYLVNGNFHMISPNWCSCPLLSWYFPVI